MKIGLFVNSYAGKGRAYREFDGVLSKLEEMGYKISLGILKKFGEGFKVLKNLLSRGIDLLITIGGDGTINEAVNLLVFKKIPLLPLPFGTGNDFVKYLYKDKKWYEILEEVFSRRVLKVDFIDVGYVKYGNKKRFFVNGFGIGFDAYVARAIRKIPFLSGDILYFLGVLLAFIGFRNPYYKVFVDDRLVGKDRFMICGVGCGQYLGGGFRLFPHASLKDGLLDIDLIKKVNFLKFLKKVNLVFKGEHLKEKEVKYLKGKKVKIISSKSVYFHIDGEVSERAIREVEIGILPKVLEVVVL